MQRGWMGGWIGLLAALMLAASAFAPSEAQQPESDFANSFSHWQQNQDVEQRIAIGEALLARAPPFSSWPLAPDRAKVIAELQFGVASAYINRAAGIRADNIESAIALFEAALPAWTFERDPENWATLQNNMGIAFWARMRGERADN